MENKVLIAIVRSEDGKVEGGEVTICNNTVFKIGVRPNSIQYWTKVIPGDNYADEISSLILFDRQIAGNIKAMDELWKVYECSGDQGELYTKIIDLREELDMEISDLQDSIIGILEKL